MNKQSILAECRANPDKIFYLLRENDFERAKELWGARKVCEFCGDSIPFNGGMGYSECCNKWPYHEGILAYKFHMQQLILAPDVLGYLEQFGKEGE